MPIPGQFERDLTEINQMHATIITKIQIIKYAGLKTTPAGNVTVDASKMFARTREQIERCLEAYAAMVQSAATGEKVSLTADD
jgi:hypothetical protein